jgi:hypothetical protein
VKHDAADVMELTRAEAGGPWRNRLGEDVDVEPEYVYPLLKGSDLARDEPPPAGRAVIVTQRSLADDTNTLRSAAPRLWAYLERHSGRFDRRKSSIYRGRPPYSVFGVGPYTFAPYKVAVSGLHKTPRFRAYGPEAGRPRVCDDTSYFLPFAAAPAAALSAALLAEPAATGLVRALLFRDAKRPVTKKLLQRIDLGAILERADRRSLEDRARVQLDAIGATPVVWPERLDTLLVGSTDFSSAKSPRHTHGLRPD